MEQFWSSSMLELGDMICQSLFIIWELAISLFFLSQSNLQFLYNFQVLSDLLVPIAETFSQLFNNLLAFPLVFIDILSSLGKVVILFPQLICNLVEGF